MNPLSNQTSIGLETDPATPENAEPASHDPDPPPPPVNSKEQPNSDDKPSAAPTEPPTAQTEIPSEDSPTADQTENHPPPREQTTEERFDQAFRAKNIGVALHAAAESSISQHFNQHFDQSINHQNHFNIYIDLKKDEPESASATPSDSTDLEWFVRYQDQSALCCFRIALAVLHGLPYTLVFDEARHLLRRIEPEPKPEDPARTDNDGFFKKGPVKSHQLEHAQALLYMEYTRKESPWGPFPQEIVRFKPDAPSPGSILKEAWQTYPTLKTPLTAWLKRLMAHPSAKVQQKAARALGFLLTEDCPHLWRECVIPALEGAFQPGVKTISTSEIFWPLFIPKLFKPALQDPILRQTLVCFFESLTHETGDITAFALPLSCLWGDFLVNPLATPDSTNTETGDPIASEITAEKALEELWFVLDHLEDWELLAWIANYSLPLALDQTITRTSEYYGTVFSRLLELCRQSSPPKEKTGGISSGSRRTLNRKEKAFWIFCHLLWRPWNLSASDMQCLDCWEHLDKATQAQMIALMAEGLCFSFSRDAILGGLEAILNNAENHRRKKHEQRLKTVWEIIQWLHDRPDSRAWVESWLERLSHLAEVGSALRDYAVNFLSLLKKKR